MMNSNGNQKLMITAQIEFAVKYKYFIPDIEFEQIIKNSYKYFRNVQSLNSGFDENKNKWN